MNETENRPLLQVEGLKIIYTAGRETVHAVNSIEFSLQSGETLGIVGETGAGKTTAALALLQLLPERTAHIKDGRILFDGQDLLELKEKEMQAIRGDKISMIFQDPMTALNPTIPVGEQILEALVFHNDKKLPQPELHKRVDEVLEMVGIPASRKKEYPHQFSGGMKQRVVIAMALACEPKLLIADEPTTALDVTIQAQVLSMIKELKERLHTAMIMITHDLGIVAQTCDMVGVMYAGEIIEFGTIRDIFESEHRHPYTEGLFGSIPNIEEDVKRLSPIDGLMPDPTDLPAGCAFSPRCPKCMDICKKRHPDSFVDGTHRIACFLFDKELSNMDEKMHDNKREGQV